MCIAVHDLERQLEVAQGQSFATTVARVANKPLIHAKPHVPIELPMGKPITKPFILLKEHKAMALPFVPATTAALPPSPDKGKSRSSSTTVNDLYADALSYDNGEWDDFEADTSVEDAQARECLVIHQMTAVLSGTSLMVPNASGSTFVEGRVMDINPRNMAEFRLLRSALKRVHNENNPHTNDLLQIICRLIGACHKSTRKTDLQKSIINQWQVPKWAETV